MKQIGSTDRCRAAAAASFSQKAIETGMLFGLACGAALLLLAATRLSETVQCHEETAASPHLRLATSAGEIGIRLYPDAAPGAVAMLTRLASEPPGAQADSANDGDFFSGQTIDYARPHVEIRTSQHPAPQVLLPQEIDAQALGLHGERIGSPGQAMNVIQNELLPAFRRARRNGELTAQLEQWMEQWYDGYEAGFLIGVSRQQINEALGLAYTQGLASRPVQKGSVMLKPASARAASAVISIALTDLPQRTGKWMVVGEVARGLALADRISTAPLDRPTHVRSRTYKPRDPVVIESVRMECG